MNKSRRAALNKIVAELEEIGSRLSDLAQEERDYFDAMPESLQGSERGEKADEVASALEDAVGDLETVTSTIADVV